MTNLEIYSIADRINTNFTGTEVLPIKLNFLFQKNNKKIAELVKEIDEARLGIGKKYGEPVENGYSIPADKIDEANKEYTELMSIEQDINFAKISIDSLPDDLSLTMAQMDALSFMIEE